MTALNDFHTGPFPGRPAANEVHLWVATLPLPPERLALCEQCLSRDERKRATIPREERDRFRFVAVRGSLRALLGRYLEMDPAEIRFAYGDHGKPSIAGPAATEISFNVSHAGDAALLAFTAGRDVGVDIERIRPVRRLERIADRVLEASEAAALRGLVGEDRLRAFFHGWTRLEAVSKLRGDGLWRTLIRRAQHEVEGVSTFELEPMPGYRAAVVVDGTDCVARAFPLD